MKRDMDIVREILCKISDAPGKPDQDLLVKDKTSEEAERVLYHVELLEAVSKMVLSRFLGYFEPWADEPRRRWEWGGACRGTVGGGAGTDSRAAAARRRAWPTVAR